MKDIDILYLISRENSSNAQSFHTSLLTTLRGATSLYLHVSHGGWWATAVRWVGYSYVCTPPDCARSASTFSTFKTTVVAHPTGHVVHEAPAGRPTSPSSPLRSDQTSLELCFGAFKQLQSTLI